MAVQAWLSSCADPIWVYDLDEHRMRWVNAAALELWQAEDDRTLFERDFGVDMSRSTRRRLDGYRTLFARGETVFDRWTLFPGGRPTTLRTIGIGIELPEAPHCMLCRARPCEVTEADLRGVEALRHTSVMITLCEVEGPVLMENPAAIAAYGFSTRDDSTHAVLDRVHDPDQAEEVLQTLRDHGRYSGELLVRTKSEVVWHGLDILTTHDPATGRAALVINETNVHSRKRGELELLAARAELEARVAERTRDLARQHAFLEGVLDTARALVFVADARGQVVRSNRALREFLGADAPTVPRSAWSMLGHGDAEAFATWMRGGAAPTDLEVQSISGRGDRAVLYWNTQVLRVDGEAFLVASGLDITERRELQIKLGLSERVESLGTLASGMAHELNNPLAYALTNVELAREQLPSAAVAAVRPYLDAASEACRRVGKIVEELKGFSSPPGPTTAVSLSAVVEAAARMAAHQVRNRARLRVELPEGLWVEGDETKLCQVVLNLLVNAAQSIDAGRADEHEIRVRGRRDDGVVLWVSDTGCGIPEADLGRIFDPFFTTKALDQGMGLGLAISHRIVAQFGGTMDAKSTVGRGSEFRVRLRAASAPHRAPAVSGESQVPPAGARVLIVDDEPGLAHAFARALSTHVVDVAVTGTEAIDKALASDFDVIVCDLMMPDFSGPEVHRALARARPTLADRMLFVTGGAFTASTREFVREMGDRVLYKPVPADVLRRSVARMLWRAPSMSPT